MATFIANAGFDYSVAYQIGRKSHSYVLRGSSVHDQIMAAFNAGTRAVNVVKLADGTVDRITPKVYEDSRPSWVAIQQAAAGNNGALRQENAIAQNGGQVATTDRPGVKTDGYCLVDMYIIGNYSWLWFHDGAPSQVVIAALRNAGFRPSRDGFGPRATIKHLFTDRTGQVDKHYARLGSFMWYCPYLASVEVLRDSCAIRVMNVYRIPYEKSTGKAAPMRQIEVQSAPTPPAVEYTPPTVVDLAPMPQETVALTPVAPDMAAMASNVQTALALLAESIAAMTAAMTAK
jgi:hypothetical protein